MLERRETSDSGSEKVINGYGEFKKELLVYMNMYWRGWSTVRSVHSGEKNEVTGSGSFE